jgi:AcrR family transcriptional regulator
MAERGRPRGFDRDLALAKAMEVFWIRGYESASIAELTAAMGIVSPSLYAAFGCKEELFREALRLYSATESKLIWGGVEAAPSARAGFESFLYATARVFTRPDKPTGCLVVLSALQANELTQTVREELIQGRLGMIEKLQARLKRGQHDGDVPARTDTKAVATFFATVQQGMSIQARDGATCTTLGAIAWAALVGWDSLVG